MLEVGSGAHSKPLESGGRSLGADEVQIVSYLAKSASELSAARRGGSAVCVGPTWEESPWDMKI